MVEIEIVEWGPADLTEYARVPIAFEVTRVYEVAARGAGAAAGESAGGASGRFTLTERAVAAPWVKDYDTVPGDSPGSWAARFDLKNWGFLAARASAPRRAGGTVAPPLGAAAVARDTPGLHMLESRRDLAVLWDIRVAPHARKQGIGRALFRAAEVWAAARGCRELKIETQNINVPACEFYARQACVLGAVDPHAYPDLPDEVQLLWYKEL